jgi:hypothetical protein
VLLPKKNPRKLSSGVRNYQTEGTKHVGFIPEKDFTLLNPRLEFSKDQQPN